MMTSPTNLDVRRWPFTAAVVTGDPVVERIADEAAEGLEQDDLTKVERRRDRALAVLGRCTPMPFPAIRHPIG